MRSAKPREARDTRPEVRVTRRQSTHGHQGHNQAELPTAQPTEHLVGPRTPRPGQKGHPRTWTGQAQRAKLRLLRTVREQPAQKQEPLNLNMQLSFQPSSNQHQGRRREAGCGPSKKQLLIVIGIISALIFGAIIFATAIFATLITDRGQPTQQEQERHRPHHLYFASHRE